MGLLSKFSASASAGVLLAGLVFGQPPGAPKPESGLFSPVDQTVDPCADFYQYACAGWMKDNPIPADESSWGRFDELLQRNQQTLRGILEDSAQHQDRSPIDRQIGAFYQSCMDESAAEKRGASPLKPELDRIQSIRAKPELFAEIARLHQLQVDVFFRFSPEPDPNNARLTIANIDQGGLGLPEKDFYFRTDQKSQDIRQKYVAHIAKMFELLGVSHSDAARKAAAVMAIETSLAKASLDVTARRDPKLLVHEMSKAQAAKLSPQFDLNQYFLRLGTPEFATLNVSVPGFFTGLNDTLNAQSLPALKDYLAWHYVSASSRLLSKAFVDENFDFFGRLLTGAPEMKPRWKRCVSATDDELGEALGRKFVEKTFGEQGKQRTLDMVHEIETQMGIDIESLNWMSPATKKEAQLKLRAVANKIGYPDKWRDYSSVTITPDAYFDNWYRANEFESKRERDKVGKPVDRAEWDMTPPTVNAYYDPTQNNINFPAGILQPPFYSNQSPDAVNYGSVGMIVGHELTHGFDDEGRQFDPQGNLKDWWTKADEQQFTRLAGCFVNEYGGFSPVPGIELNGKLTLGENTADNGGMHLAYLALLDDLARKSIPLTSKTEGYTQPQQFFVGFAQVWCESQRPELARLLAQTDPHSPAKFRVDGVVSNMPEFSQAFGCKAGDKMFAVNGCRVW